MGQRTSATGDGATVRPCCDMAGTTKSTLAALLAGVLCGADVLSVEPNSMSRAPCTTQHIDGAHSGRYRGCFGMLPTLFVGPSYSAPRLTCSGSITKAPSGLYGLNGTKQPNTLLSVGDAKGCNSRYLAGVVKQDRRGRLTDASPVPAIGDLPLFTLSGVGGGFAWRPAMGDVGDYLLRWIGTAPVTEIKRQG